ncbi:hypothetical protein PM082_008260 [Marasmius tenuissimus]|nr:hypothetical protein PM082_008260 [Marasmius tenuissimus]
MRQPKFPEKLPIDSPPSLYSKTYPYYKLAVAVSLKELRKKLPDLRICRDNYNTATEAVRHYMPKYAEHPTLPKVIRMSYIPHPPNTEGGVTFYLVSNRSQKLLDMSKDQEYLQQVRDVLDLDADTEFFWKRLGSS